MQRHPHDTVERLPSPHADPNSPLFVPLELRAAYNGLGDDFEEDLKRQLHREITEPWAKTINGRHHIINHRSSADDFDIGLHWLKLDEARRRVARDNERRADHERDQRTFTCKLCGRYDPTANNSGLVVGGIPNIWCKSCRDEWARQDLVEHAGIVVNGKTVAELVGAARRERGQP